MDTHKRLQHRDAIIECLQALQDALLRVEKGTATRRTAQIAAKLGTTYASASALFGAASFFGTASTGTAIATLSGAAFTNAALAWLGGSVFVGGFVVFAVPLLAGGVAWVGTKRAWQKWGSGNPRSTDELDAQEKVVVHGIDCLLNPLTLDRDKEANNLPECVYYSIWKGSLTPLIEVVEAKLEGAYTDWPFFAKRRVRKTLEELKHLKTKAEGNLATTASIPLGVFAATLLQTFGGNYDYTGEQQLVIEAFRRSANRLADATPSEISTYLSGMDASQRRGALSNIKGIYHEMVYVQEENLDGDEWRAELMLDVNHPGSDVLKFNTKTGEIKEIQLKAVEDRSTIERHYERYEGIDLEATEEVAENAGVASSGFSNEKLTQSVDGAVRIIEHEESAAAIAEDALEAGLIASVITFSLNFGGALKAGQSVTDAGETSVGTAATSFKWAAGTAALFELFM